MKWDDSRELRQRVEDRISGWRIAVERLAETHSSSSCSAGAMTSRSY